MYIKASSIGLLCSLLLAGCGDVRERTLTPSVLESDSKLKPILRRLQPEDRELLVQYVLVYRFEVLPVFRGEPLVKQRTVNVGQAIDIYRQFRKINEDCHRNLSPVAVRLADLKLNSTSNSDAVEVELNRYTEIKAKCFARKRAVK
ncbi:hypothetical protein ATDW_35920 (plasmid) [Asticcacaulis sp. DW145]|uniref:hypothetical protein n=1 Tax=Asticcacaulis sp. DW145 TaxID=3095608 RepID=UPI003093669E|nr:hypothetical protein ATDW_35920 [Asticcacaulis sp. DW145]